MGQAHWKCCSWDPLAAWWQCSEREGLGCASEVHHAAALKPSFSSVLTLAGGGALAAAHGIPRPGPAGQRGQPEHLSLCRRTLREEGSRGASYTSADDVESCVLYWLAVCCALPTTGCHQLASAHVGKLNNYMLVANGVRVYVSTSIIHQTARLRGWERCTGAACLRGWKKRRERGAGNDEQQIAEVTSAGRGAESAGATG